MHRVTIEDRHRLAREINLLAKRWRQCFDERLRSIDMTEARWCALYSLAREPEGLSQTALAQRAGVESATLVRTLDTLERQGLVRRQPSLRDRRINVVRMTEAADPVVAEVETLGEKLGRQAMAAFTFEEYQTLLELLRRMRTGLDAAVEAPPETILAAE